MADHRGDHRGQSMAELALVLPVLLLLLVICIDFGRLYLGWVNLQNMARIAANYAANYPTANYTADAMDPAYADAITNDAKATNCALVTVPTPVFSATTVGGTVTVDMTCEFTPITPIIATVLGN